MSDAAKKRILLIDDEAPVREAHRRLLERSGYDARAVASVDDAIGTAQTWVPDLILLDLVMAHTRGRESLAALRADSATRRAITIAFSGMIMDEDARQFRAWGFDGVLPKALPLEEFVARIAAFFHPPEAAPR